MPVLNQSWAEALPAQRSITIAIATEIAVFLVILFFLLFSELPVLDCVLLSLQNHRLKSNQYSTFTLEPEYPGGKWSSGLLSRIERTADVSTELLPLDFVT